MTRNILDEVKKVRKELESRKQKRAELDGRRKQLLQQLQDDFGLGSLEAAKAEADRLETELEEKDKQLQSMLKELDEMRERMVA